MAQAQPKDIVAFMCWLDSSGKGRRTIVHGMHCKAVGTQDLKSCSTEEGACARRYAHDSLRSNHVTAVFDTPPHLLLSGVRSGRHTHAAEVTAVGATVA